MKSWSNDLFLICMGAYLGIQGSDGIGRSAAYILIGIGLAVVITAKVLNWRTGRVRLTDQSPDGAA